MGTPVETSVVSKVRVAWPDVPPEAISAGSRDVEGEDHVFLVVSHAGPRHGTYDLGRRVYALSNLVKFLAGKESPVLKQHESPPGAARLSPDQIDVDVLGHIDDVLAATRAKLVKSMTVTRHGRLAKLARTRNINEVAVLLASAILGESR